MAKKSPYKFTDITVEARTGDVTLSIEYDYEAPTDGDDLTPATDATVRIMAVWHKGRDIKRLLSSGLLDALEEVVICEEEDSTYEASGQLL